MSNLPALQESLWQSYLNVNGLREVRVQALDRFIVKASELENDVVCDWARDIARRVVDERQSIPIQQPLFDSIIYPALWSGCKVGLPGCYRWLAGLSGQLSRFYRRSAHGNPDSLAIEFLTETDLLTRAVAIDRDDTRSRERLVQIMANQFDYAIHELPAGVLYGSDGATIEQCKELFRELALFREHVDYLELGPRYSKLMSSCDFHFSAYAAYMAESSEWASYEEYLGSLNDSQARN